MKVSRRTVMAGAFGALGSAALSAQDKPIHIGMIGLGLRAGAHLSALRKLPDAKITALCDIQPDRITKVNEGLPEKAAAYADYKQLVRDPRIAVVVIITPGFLHHEMTVAALQAGKDVMLEKPMGINYAQAIDIKRQAEKSGRILAVGMQRRYTRSDAEIQEVIDSGTLGPIRLVSYNEYREDWNPRTWQYTDPDTGKKISWRFLKKTAGSSELEFSIHSFAMVTNVVKSPVVKVAASGGVLHYKDRDTRDVSTLVAEFANGARLSYSFSCFAGGGGTGCTMVGDRGVIRRDRGESSFLTLSGGKTQPLPRSARLSDDPAEVQLYRDLFQCVRRRTPSALNADAALEPSKIAFAADLSIAEGRMVNVKELG
jgi:predicted dehydrogenase